MSWIVLPRPMSSARQPPRPSAHISASQATPRRWYGRSSPSSPSGSASSRAVSSPRKRSASVTSAPSTTTAVSSPSTVRVPASAPASTSATRTRPVRRRSRSRSNGSATTHRPRTRINGRFASTSASSSASVSTSPSTVACQRNSTARRGSDRPPPRSPAPGSPPRHGARDSSGSARPATAPRNRPPPTTPPPARAAPRSRPRRGRPRTGGRRRASARAGARHDRHGGREEQVGLGLLAETCQHDGGHVPQLVGVDHERRVDAAAELDDARASPPPGASSSRSPGRAPSPSLPSRLSSHAPAPDTSVGCTADHAGDDTLSARPECAPARRRSRPNSRG